jgi:dipeptide/tripeptide permease
MAEKKKGLFGSFPAQFWLVVIFEFFERGSYYGMMSFISVYFVNVLDFPKESVGVIKGVIQPLLYFLPIVSGALADRFGYRRLLMIAFALLGSGYFLTSQTTTYGAVFASLVIMGLGAGTFKPLISGTIAKVTDESNSSIGFGIFYWSINLGAFLFPLFLVPFLKGLNPRYVIIASAICTSIMIVPTALFYKDPVSPDKTGEKQTNLLQTLANAFEIIYSPIVLLYYQMKKSVLFKNLALLLLAGLFIYSLFQYLEKPDVTRRFSKIGIVSDNSVIHFDINRNMLGREDFSLSTINDTGNVFQLTLHKPEYLDRYSANLISRLRQYPGFEDITVQELNNWIAQSDSKIQIEFKISKDITSPFRISEISESHYIVTINRATDFENIKTELLNDLHSYPVLRSLTIKDCDELYEATNNRKFFLLFVASIILIGLTIIFFSNRATESATQKNTTSRVPAVIIIGLGIFIWLLPGLALLGRIIATVIYLTVSSLFIIDKTDSGKFVDHAKFLLMIFLYSGFWILYFQMFDSVLWYVQAYVDAGSLNSFVNKFLGIFGININWFFDVEHVTVINAGTIILLQLVISRIVKNTKALPTMMIGIAMGTIGMAILAVNTSIWVFMVGIIIFSIGEMTAHPKFISYIGLVAPKDKKAMYMGYLFLYGVFGSSIGGILGAKLYVHFVDILNQPRTLWLIFSMIGVFTIISLSLYNKFLIPKETGK